MAIKARITLQFTVAGLCWTAIGVLRFLPERNILLEVMQWVMLAVACVATIISILSKKDIIDEMVQNHFSEAAAWGFMATMICILLLLLFSNLFFTLEYNQVYPFLLGIPEIVVGIRFFWLEDKGDCG